MSVDILFSVLDKRQDIVIGRKLIMGCAQKDGKLISTTFMK